VASLRRGELDLDTARRSITEAGREVGLEIDLFEMLKYMSSDGGPRLSVIERTRRLRRRLPHRPRHQQHSRVP
jgi:hypothetical protein